MQLFESWKNSMWDFVTNLLGINKENLRWRAHTDEERSFYSTRTEDLEYNFSFGYKELWGLAYRTDYDLKQHMKFSGSDLMYTDPKTGNIVTPHVIEPAVGINRLFLMVLQDAYWKDEQKKRINRVTTMKTYTNYKIRNAGSDKKRRALKKAWVIR